MKKFVFAMLCAGVLLSCTGCGTVFFSYRMGRKASQVVDNRVFYGNCFLCLFGVVPGVVAFFLDYENGTIYYTQAELLPDDLYGRNSLEQMKKISCPQMSFEEISGKLSAALGKEITVAELKEAVRHKETPALF